MILGLIFSILSVTYTVASSNSVNVTGEAPVSSDVVYMRSSTTGQKGQMTAGNSTTLQLSGWDGCIIHSIVLSMHSNTSQGAGSLRMRIGKNVVWNIEDTDFADVAWNGSFSTGWVDIGYRLDNSLGLVGKRDNIEIYIEASENSLYIGSYTIFYTLPDPVAYEVKLVSGMTENPDKLVEEAVASGVVLPMGIDTLDWHFLGWSEEEVMDPTACPPLLRAGERYFPKSDCTLWAVYSDLDRLISKSDCQSGDYILANHSAYWSVALRGAVLDDHQISTTNISVLLNDDGYYELKTGVQDNLVYHIEFLEDSMLTIEHVESQKTIGFNGTKLYDKESVWNYRLLSDGTLCIYYKDDNQRRMLSCGYGIVGMNENVMAYAVNVTLDLMQKNGMILFPAIKAKYTSWPFGKFDAVEDVISSESNGIIGEYVLYFGMYELHIQNGQKRLVISR